MKPRRQAIAIAMAGTAAGATGLGVLAVPASAGTAPELPPVAAEKLVASVLKSDAPALSGTVSMTNEMGLPSMPGLPALASESARVFHDGEGRSRLALERENGEYTVVAGKDVLWTYDSEEKAATRTELPAHAKDARGARVNGHNAADPATMARLLVSEAGRSSTVSVDGTASVADRPAYELVLTPKPDERTLLREVRIAVDAQTRLPLRLSVLTHGTTEPALEVGFTELDLEEQSAELFRFTPPRGTEVTDRSPQDAGSGQPPKDARRVPKGAGESGFEVVGRGWDAVALTRLPTDPGSAGSRADTSGPADPGPAGPGMGGRGMNGRGEIPAPGSMTRMLEQYGTRVTGPYGSGHLITTEVVSALITDDGRVAVGAVPEPVLAEALSSR